MKKNLVKGIFFLLFAFLLFASLSFSFRVIQHYKYAELQKVEGNQFVIHLNPDDCQVDIERKLKLKSQYTETIEEAEGRRNILINSIANHKVGAFPNQGNPHTISEHKWSFSIPLRPQIAEYTTSGQGYDTGVLFSGVSLDPFTAEFFIGSNGSMNREWNITTLSSLVDLGLDCNNAHVQPTGKYHYHGTPSAYLQKLGVDGTEMVKVGYAADGFPIYYKYGYDENGKIITHQSGYHLKEGKRSGDGKTSPDGYFNGMYFNDYEYIVSNSILDKCNGRWGKTPESEKEYYYVITDNFPSIPLCFSGTPSEDLHKMKRRPHPRRQGRSHRPPPRGRRHLPPPPRF